MTTMELVLDEAGHVKVQDGKPLYRYADGKEVAFDAPGTVATITRLNGEAKSHRLKAEEFEGKLKIFEGLDAEAARKALETVSNLDAKKLIDAGEVERIKVETAKTYEEKMRAMDEQAKTYMSERDGMKKALDAERLGNAFANSKFVKERVAVPPDMMQNTFGAHFRHEDGGIFAYDASGNKMLSRQYPGEYAKVDEALEMLVDAHPYRDSILKGSGASGGGAPGSGGAASGSKAVNRQQLDGMSAADRAAFFKSGGKLTD